MLTKLYDNFAWFNEPQFGNVRLNEPERRRSTAMLHTDAGPTCELFKYWPMCTNNDSYSITRYLFECNIHSTVLVG